MKRAFYYHYNKPASLKFKCPKLSLHFKDACYIVDKVQCLVPSGSRNRKTQPRCVMAGYASSVVILNGVATIS